MAKKKVKKTVKKTAKTVKKAAVKKTVKKKKATKSASKKKTAKKAAKKTVSKAPKKATPKTTRKTSTKKRKVKTVVSKPAVSNEMKPKRRRRRRKTTLSKSELLHFRELLIEKLKEIIGDVDHIESEALKRSRLDASGDLSSMPIHMADIGSDNYEQEFALGLMHSERKLVQEIYAALKRIEDSTYGICEGTGEPIPKPRLEGIPWARYCVEYAEKLEKGLVSEEDRWYDYDEEPEEDFDDEQLDFDEDNDDEDEDNIFFYGYDDDDEEDEELV